MTERELREALHRAAAGRAGGRGGAGEGIAAAAGGDAPTRDGDGRQAEAEARERSWRVVQAACADTEREARLRSGAGLRAGRGRRDAPRRGRRWPVLAVVLALMPVAAAGVAAASAPHSGVGRWVRGVIGVGEPHARPVLGRIPGGGRLLVQAGASAWVVSGDGAKRRLGAFAGASWSPRGLFVIAWGGRELTALDPGGGVRWSLARPQRITSARWGPVDGFRIAYVAGDELRIVNGDGSGDHRYATVRAGVAPDWRPDNAHVLAYVDTRGRVDVVAVDARQRLWRSARLRDPQQLAWSPSGRRLLVVTKRRLILFDGSGRRLLSRAVPAGSVVTGARWSPRGRGVAIVRYDAAAGGSELVVADAAHGLAERRLSSGPGRFGAPAWSPAGGRLLLPWPDADQWLFLRPGRGGTLTAVANVAAQFGPGRTRPAFPAAAQWCCTTR